MDTRTRMLTRAAEIWQEALPANADARMKLAHELSEMELFSNRQIAKIARVSSTSVGRRLPKRENAGGRLHPATLSGLVYVREYVVAGKPLPMSIVRGIVEGGTSLSNLCRLTGAPRATLYNKFKED